jgi:hypothetical protein
MARLMMLAGGIVEPGGGRAGAVSAYVVLSASRGSRIFKVQGPTDGATVSELPGATTIDLGRFQTELSDDLAPELEEIRSRGGAASITTPRKDWVCNVVREHLKAAEGIEVG